MFMKRALALFLGCVLTISILGGCSKNKDVAIVMEDMNTVPETPYQINMYLRAEPQSDVNSIEMAVNEYLKDKLNATLKLNILDSQQYKQKMSTMMAAGEYFDLMYCAGWLFDYSANSRAGAFAELDDYLDTYLKESVAGMDDVMLESAKVDGKTYALPVNKEYTAQVGWIYRKDIADKYGIDMSLYKNYDELEPILMMIKENEPDLQYPADWDNYPPLKFTVKDSKGIFLDGTYPDDQVIDIVQTPEYLAACETARRFYLNGLVKKDILTNSDAIQRMKDGKTFCYSVSLKPGKVTELFPNSRFPLAQIGVDDVRVDNLPGRGSLMAVSSTSKNPVRVARFLNLLNTDPYLKNLMIHGIEGKHYTKVSDVMVEKIPGSSYDLYPGTWTMGNIFIDYITTNDMPDKLQALREFNSQGLKHKSVFFNFEYSDEFNLISQNLGEIGNQYYKQVAYGAVDTKPVMDEWIAKRKAAGSERLLEEQNRQYKLYLENLDWTE